MTDLIAHGFRNRLRSGAPGFMAWSGLSDTTLVGYMSRAGYDAILLDQQHGLHDTASCIACISEAALTRTSVLVRVSVNDFAQAARMLDCGAAGVVAPMINSAEDARRFVSCVKYPPVGQRSFGPGRAMQLLGATDDQAFIRSSNEDTLAIAMCETREALEDLDAILDVPGLDGLLVGPADLSRAHGRDDGPERKCRAKRHAGDRAQDAREGQDRLRLRGHGRSLSRACTRWLSSGVGRV